MLVRTLLATACAIESGHLTLLRGAGRGRLSKELATRRRRGARGGVDRRSDNATSHFAHSSEEEAKR